MPIDKDVINRVKEMALSEEAPVMSRGYPIFTWKRQEVDRLPDEIDDDYQDDNEGHENNVDNVEEAEAVQTD